MAVDERRDRWRQIMPGEIETAHNFPRDILRGIFSPMFARVERDYADRVAVLAGHQIADDGFDVGLSTSVSENAAPKFPKLLMTR
jgi:hypothetical protein